MVDGEGVDDVSVLVADAFQLPDLLSDVVDVPLQVLQFGELVFLSVHVVGLQVLQVLLDDPDIVLQRFLQVLLKKFIMGL